MTIKSVFRKYQNEKNNYKKLSSIRDDLNSMSRKQLIQQYNKTSSLENKTVVLSILDDKYNENHLINPKNLKMIKTDTQDNILKKKLR